MSRAECSMSLITSAHFIYNHADILGPRFWDGDTSGLTQIPYDTSALNVDEGLAFAKQLPSGMPDLKTPAEIRIWLDAWMQFRRPNWISAFPYGRNRALQVIPEITHQCFRVAGLLDSTLSADAVRWWDAWASVARSDADARKLQQGRRYEMRSLALETEFLRRQGLEKEAEWTSLNDNSAGYDIRSFRSRDGILRDHFIEVKSSLYSESFFITRNEWEVAKTYREKYEIQFWRPETDRPQVIAFDSLNQSVPMDTRCGCWEIAKISVNQEVPSSPLT